MNALIDPIELRKTLEGYTRDRVVVFNGGDYLGMSQLWRCPVDLVAEMRAARDGMKPPGLSDADMVAIYEGRLHHEEMRSRCALLEGYKEAPELANYENQLRGHPDGEVVVEGGRVVVDFRAVGSVEFTDVRVSKRASPRDYQRVQAYMLYGGYPQAVVIYKNRETGSLWPVVVWPHEWTQTKLDTKAAEVLHALADDGQVTCECGRHVTTG